MNERGKQSKRYNSFKDFYPYYLSQHQNPKCRGLHYIGSLLVVILLMSAIISGSLELLMSIPVVGYGFAWLGHLMFEKNRPATFEYPLFSLMADWLMFGEKLARIWSGSKYNRPL
ncbi:Mpo1-like protein [Shewanella atlantica]|uniref:Mpo1-like protein n=2 Tax=Shewanella TaxID=22 RepID=UPI0037353EA2